MECQRCLTGKEAKYRVYTDMIDMKVCEVCADEARKLGLAVEVLEGGKKTTKACTAPSLWFTIYLQQNTGFAFPSSSFGIEERNPLSSDTSDATFSQSYSHSCSCSILWDLISSFPRGFSSQGP